MIRTPSAWPLPIAAAALLLGCGTAASEVTSTPEPIVELSMEDLPRSEDAWQERLSPEEFRVLRQQGTERAFSGAYWNNHADGVYHCAGCGVPLFSSAHKFDSGTGWPSYWQPINEQAVAERVDTSHGMRRTEVVCARCGGHLGHVFGDGPQPTGQRYCINSVSLDFAREKPQP